MLLTRILTAVVLIPLVLGALFLLPPTGFALALLVVFLIAGDEWARLCGFGFAGRIVFDGGLALLAANLLFGAAAGFDRGWPAGVVVAVCGVAALFWVVVATPWVVRRWPMPPPILRAVTGWIVLTGAFVALVELQVRSPWLALAAMATVWIADTAAYFAGRAFGRHKLAPAVSPGKTWEGVAGAIVAVALYAAALVPLARPAGFRYDVDVLPTVGWILVMLALAAVSIVGDLFESWMKRQAGVKDSGALLPGHGGVLDRIDALLAAMPAAALAAVFFLMKR